jgi:hypothetical protein
LKMSGLSRPSFSRFMVSTVDGGESCGFSILVGIVFGIFVLRY